MWHLVAFFIKLIIRESKKPGTISQAQQMAEVYQHEIMAMENMERMTKDDFIRQLGKPNKITNLDQGMQSLIWKGNKYKIEIFVDALDRFHHKTELYT